MSITALADFAYITANYKNHAKPTKKINTKIMCTSTRPNSVRTTNQNLNTITTLTDQNVAVNELAFPF